MENLDSVIEDDSQSCLNVRGEKFTLSMGLLNQMLK